MSYGDLPLLDGTDQHHAWAFFGEGDELGTLNRIGPQQLVEAAGLVRSGRVISLNLPLDEPGPLAEGRESYRHHVEVERHGRDDRLDNFFLQGSSQWDGLRHVRYRQHGYFGGRQEEDLDASGVLGIDRVAERGVFGRGVLLDVAGFHERAGRPWAVGERTEITVEMLDAVVEAQGLELRNGDILLVRSGWLGWFLSLGPDDRAVVGKTQTMRCVGLESGPEMAAWLWDHGVAAVACDNPAVEALPIVREKGFLHHRILPLLGFLVGELWRLDELAADCAGDGRYEGLLVSAPLHLPRGVGSPANAYMIK